MVKIITKRIHERLDNFIFQEQPNTTSNDGIDSMIPQSKKTIKKTSDGLIERLEVNKILMTEDNKQLLTD